MTIRSLFNFFWVFLSVIYSPNFLVVFLSLIYSPNCSLEIFSLFVREVKTIFYYKSSSGCFELQKRVWRTLAMIISLLHLNEWRYNTFIILKYGSFENIKKHIKYGSLYPMSWKNIFVLGYFNI